MRRRKKVDFYDQLAHSTRKVARKIKHKIKEVPKKQALLIAILFAVAGILIIGVLLFAQISELFDLGPLEQKSDDEIARTCNTDIDCVTDSCCHSFRCVNKRFGPSCAGVACTLDCQPGTMDCNGGYCACTNGLCEAYILNT